MYYSSKPPHAIRVATLLLMLTLATGCENMVKSLGEIAKLRSEIIKEFGEKETNINLNNNVSLTITFINSRLNDRSADERAQLAQNTATFVTNHYPSIGQIREIWISFIRSQTRYVVIHYSETLNFYGFDQKARPLTNTEPEASDDSAEPSVRPTAIYSSGRNQTEVSISYLQIEGTFAHGLSLTPHFTVPGDASGVRRSETRPDFVSLDFTSRSDISMFPGQSKITALSDRKVVFDTSGNFATSRSAEGKYSESLMLRIPYPVFLRLTAGQTLTLRFADREYEFTTAQIESLRKMTEYVRENQKQPSKPPALQKPEPHNKNNST